MCVYYLQQRVERDIVSADRESNSSIENTSSRRRQKSKANHNQSNSGMLDANIKTSDFRSVTPYDVLIPSIAAKLTALS